MNLGMLRVKLFKPPRMESVAAATKLTGRPDCQAALTELAGDFGFHESLDTRLRAVLNCGYSSDGFAEFLYCVVRVVKPEIVIETGVFQGSSSAYILRAMDRNGSGRLISIDLPARADTVAKDSTERMGESLLPPGLQPGWVIPDPLRTRHELLLGDSKVLLPDVLKHCSLVDIFIHDSLHTADHMSWEYRSAWPHIRESGYLLSDDIFWNPAFHAFSASVNRPYVNGLGKFGGIRRGS